jgi:hypothetical protein
VKTRDERGTAAVELVLIVPVLIVAFLLREQLPTPPGPRRLSATPASRPQLLARPRPRHLAIAAWTARASI